MDLRLTEGEKLIKKTAAEFVDRELIAREGSFLKQTEAFLPPGAPARRELDGGIRADLIQRARANTPSAGFLPKIRAFRFLFHQPPLK